MYRSESLRVGLKKEAATVNDYLAMLETHVTIAAAGEADLGRLEQMFQRTNQFNVTSKRYSISELRHLAISPEHAFIVASMSDKFGSFGVIATALLVFQEKAVIDSFLMSCRVIGRGVEAAALAHLARLAADRGYRELYGEFLPTKRNQPARDLYAGMGS